MRYWATDWSISTPVLQSTPQSAALMVVAVILAPGAAVRAPMKRSCGVLQLLRHCIGDAGVLGHVLGRVICSSCPTVAAASRLRGPDVVVWGAAAAAAGAAGGA